MGCKFWRMTPVFKCSAMMQSDPESTPNKGDCQYVLLATTLAEQVVNILLMMQHVLLILMRYMQEPLGVPPIAAQMAVDRQSPGSV